MPALRFAAGFFVAMIVVGVSQVSAQDYPNRPVRILTAPAGGGNDFAARLVGQGITGPLGQQVIVDNRPGVVAVETAVKSAPNGYTLLLASNSLWLQPLLRENMPYDPVKDFLPVSLTTSSPIVLVAHPSLPVRSVKELIALAKARPGELNYASGPAGTPNHLAAEMLNYMAGIKITRIAYKGGGPALIDLLAGQVQLLFASAASVVQHVKSGRLRALAVTSKQPSALIPGLPTVAASGMPNFESISIYGVFVPAKTPAAVISRLNLEIVRVLKEVDVKDKFFNAGVETVGSSPEELGAAVKTDMTMMGQVIKNAGIREE